LETLKCSAGTVNLLKVKVLSTVLYYYRLSYRVTVHILKCFADFIHEALCLWFKRLKTVFPKTERKRRKSVAVSETGLGLNSKQLYVWAAAGRENQRGVNVSHLAAVEHHAD
jgi:transposase-like protein